MTHQYMELKLKELEKRIKALEQEPCEDAISRAEAIRIASGFCHHANVAKELAQLPSVNVTDTNVGKIGKDNNVSATDKRIERYKKIEDTMKEIVKAIQLRYPYLEGNMTLKMRIGSSLNRRHFEKRHHENGNSYVMIAKKAA